MLEKSVKFHNKHKSSGAIQDFSSYPGEPGHPESVPGHHSEGEGQHQPSRHELARVGEPENMSYFGKELVFTPESNFQIRKARNRFKFLI